MENWSPKTILGKEVYSRQITDINEILDNGHTILEPEIVDTLLPEMDNDLLLVGQSKGKFGGGRRRVFRQTQKKTREGNKPQFAAYAVIGNKDGIVGLGYGKARETVPARDKALRKAKLNIFKIARGSGSWESTVQEPHTVPFTVSGRCGSVRVVLFPAPKGKGLVAEKEIQKILEAAGIQDVWSRTFGQTKNKINLIKATEEALRKLVTTKLRPQDIENLSVHYGATGETRIAAQVAPTAEEVAVQTAEQKITKEDMIAPIAFTDLSGVGAATVKKFEAGGITSVEDLAGMKPEVVAEKTGISPTTANKAVLAAKVALEKSK